MYMVISSHAYVLAFIGLMISLGGALFAYLVSTGGGFPQLKGWAQKEFKELLFSALIIFLGFFLLHQVVLLACAAVIEHSGPLDIKNPIYFTQAKVFLKVMDLNIQEIASRGIRTSSILSGYSRYSVTLGFPIPIASAAGVIISGSIQPLAGLSLIAGVISDITKTVIMTNFLISVMDSLLYFIQTTSFTIFFPLGIILRALPITRKLGSTIIALSITFYFIFPMTILFNQYIYLNMFLGDLSYDTENPESISYLQEQLEDRLENETKIEEKTEEYYPAAGSETQIGEFSNYEEKLNEIERESSGWVSNLGNKIKNFFSSIGRMALEIKDTINNTINLLFRNLLKTISKFAVALASVALGINLTDFIAEPMHYTTALANQVLQKFIFITLCFFMDVVICLTLFANISGLIGGETKIFGIEKLKLG